MAKIKGKVALKAPGFYAKLDGPGLSEGSGCYGRGIILTTEPWEDGAIIDPTGVDWGPLVQYGWVYDHRAVGMWRFDNIVGEVKLVERVEHPEAGLAWEVAWLWLNKDRFAPGRYGVGFHGAALERRGDLITKSKAISVALTIYNRSRDGYCYVDIEEGDQE